MKTPLIFLDTETTGLKVDKHRPWEVGWMTAIHDVDQGRLVMVDREVWHLHLSAQDEANADPVAMTIGRHDERWGTAEVESDETLRAELHASVARVAERCATDITSVHLVGAVPSFDHNMLCQHVLGWPGFGEGMWHYHLVDVETLVAGACRVPPPLNTAHLTRACGLDPDAYAAGKHTALGDVEWARDLYAAVYGLTIVEGE